MNCALCHAHIDLWDLDVDTIPGVPTHGSCAAAYKAEVDAVLADAQAMVLAETDPRKHRRHLRPAA